MRIPIREQLTLLMLLASATGLCVISVGAYVTTYTYVVGARTSVLAVSASLKASQLTSSLALMENSAQFTASRIVLQQTLARYNNNGSVSAQAWHTAQVDVDAAINGPASGGAVGVNLLLQSQIFPVSNNGTGGAASLINNTNTHILGQIKLPGTYPNGSSIYLGDAGPGYPSQLYPNFTYTETEGPGGESLPAVNYNGQVLSAVNSQALLLGPYALNSSYAVLSITIPIINTSSANSVLGWLTVVMDARLITEVIYGPIDATGELLIVRPVNSTNKYPPNVLYNDNPQPSVYNNVSVNFVLPLGASDLDRHPNSVYGAANLPFNMSRYTAVLAAITQAHSGDNNSGGMLKATNEAGKSVSVGYAKINNSFVDWAVLAEMTRSSAFASINALRRVILAALFGTLGTMIVIVWPLAHVASRPIRDLRSATLKSAMPPGYNASSDSLAYNSEENNGAGPGANSELAASARKEGFFTTILRRKTKTTTRHRSSLRRQQFRVPIKVPERKHIVMDELSDLTRTFNEMSDELMMQYERLEERVKQRTAELELSKKAAEAANESKTLFIANISHELKTPLNGILGMCAVCMQEDDPVRLKRSLGIIYKSGDLLLNLLTDLLTFSKNQVGQQLTLDEKEFHLRDFSSQVLTIFDKQARDSQIDLRVEFMRAGEVDSETAVGERVKDMVLWGDSHRILQVIINLVSNSLKFTPPHGSVTLNVKCVGAAQGIGSRKTSHGSGATKRSRSNHSDTCQADGSQDEGPAHIDQGGAFKRMIEVERLAPPPGKMYTFEFEVIDTGPGIPEHLHQRIFEPFVQGDLGLSKKYGGTGLGLSICSQLAGLMRGNMSISSAVGRGSTFAMRVPLRHLLNKAGSTASSNASQNGDAASTFSAFSINDVGSPSRKNGQPDNISVHPAGNVAASPQPETGPFEASQPRLVGLSQPYFASSQPMESPNAQQGLMEHITSVASKSGKIRVLVAEDNQVNQEVVLRMLKLEDIYDVTVAKDGQEAYDLVKESMSTEPDSLSKGPFNLIFMDVQMPNLDGLQSTKLIRECGFDAPIVALTAFAEESNVKDCLDSGMNYFLSKPIRRPALKKVLKEYCSTIQEEMEEDATTPPEPVMTKKSFEANGPPRTPRTNEENLGSGHKKQIPVDVMDVANIAGGTTVIAVSQPNSVDLQRRSLVDHDTSAEL